MAILLIFAWIFQLTPIPVSAEDTEPVEIQHLAVFPFKVGNLPVEYGQSIPTIIQELIQESNKYKLVDLENIRLIMAEIARGQGGLCESDCERKAIELSRAEFILTGSANLLSATECQVAATISEVNTGNIVITKSENCPCTPEDIRAASHAIAYKLIDKPFANGTLVIQSMPTSSKIYLDGKKLAKTTTATLDVKPGKHNITVKSNVNFHTGERSVYVGPQEPREVKISMEKKSWYETWWFWTIVGTTAAGGVAAVAASGGDSGTSSSGGGGGGGGGGTTGTISISITGP